MNRPDFAEYSCWLAIMAASRSEDPNTQVGCCVLNKEGRILSLGYNGLLPKFKYDPHWSRDDKLKYFVHAEQNAFSMLSREDNPYIIGLTISPCASCALQIANLGIKNVYFLKEYHRETNFRDIFKFYDINYQKIKLDKSMINDHIKSYL